MPKSDGAAAEIRGANAAEATFESFSSSRKSCGCLPNSKSPMRAPNGFPPGVPNSSS
jgi:hypothetical protein